MLVTRALHPHHLDDLLHGFASSHWALDKRALRVLGRRSISGLKRGSKCIIRSKRGGGAADTGGAYYEAHAVVRWFTTSHSVLPTLSRGLLVLWGWREFFTSADILTNLLPRSN